MKIELDINIKQSMDQKDIEINTKKMNIDSSEIDIFELINNLKEVSYSQSKFIFNQIEEQKIKNREDYIENIFSNKIYYKDLIKTFISILKFKKSTFINANLLFDSLYLILTLNNHLTSNKDLELYCLSCVIISSKTEENDPDVPSLYTFGTLLNTKYFSVENLKKSEIIILKYLNYNINIVSCYSIISCLIINGILFEEDFICDEQKKYDEQQYFNIKEGNILNKINSLCQEIAFKIVFYPYIIKYDQYFLTSGIVMYVRKSIGIQIWNEKLEKYGFIKDDSIKSLLIIEDIINFIDDNKSAVIQNETNQKKEYFNHLNNEYDKNKIYEYKDSLKSKNNIVINDKNFFQKSSIIDNKLKINTNQSNHILTKYHPIINDYKINQTKPDLIRSYQNIDLLYKTKKIFQRTNQIENTSNINNEYSSLNLIKKYSNMDIIQKTKRDNISIMDKNINSKIICVNTNREIAPNFTAKKLSDFGFYFDYNKLKDDKGLYSSFNKKYN